MCQEQNAQRQSLFPWFQLSGWLSKSRERDVCADSSWHLGITLSLVHDFSFNQRFFIQVYELSCFWHRNALPEGSRAQFRKLPENLCNSFREALEAIREAIISDEKWRRIGSSACWKTRSHWHSYNPKLKYAHALSRDLPRWFSRARPGVNG